RRDALCLGVSGEGGAREHCSRAGDLQPRGALPRDDRRRVRRQERAAGGGRVTAVYRWEIVKLASQKRTSLGLGAAMLVPLVFVVVLQFQSGGPNDVPLGRYIRDTGLAVPFVALFFMSFWAFPLITSLVAGDVVASESHNGTLKTVLTRSRERGQVFAGKVLAALTYTAVVVLAMATVGLLAGGLAWGFNPLTSLSGTQVSTGHGLALLA